MELLKQHYRFINVNFGGFDCSISNVALSLLLPTFVMIIAYFFLSNSRYYPLQIQNFLELIYEKSYDFILSQVGRKSEYAVSWLIGLMFYIILLNLTGLFPWNYASTGQLMINFSLAIIVFCFVFVSGFKKYGFRLWNHFILDVPVAIKPFLFLLELISFLIRPITLAVRLSINVLVGHLVLSILYDLASKNLKTSFVVFAFSIFFSIFEMFVSFLQGYIFITLACIYIAEMGEGH